MSDLSKINFGGTEYNIKDTTARTDVSKKVTASGGDISNTKIVTADNITTEFPVPAANDTAKGFLGKMKKFCTDFNSFKTGVITLGKLVNNGQCTEPGFAMDARYGKTLYDLFAQLNRDFAKAIEAESNGRMFKAGVNALGMAYIQCQFADGTIQELHITPDGEVKSLYYNGSEWKLNGTMATRNDLSVKIITSGSVFALSDGRYYCAATVANMPNSSYGYVEMSTWEDEKMLKVYDLKANANMYLNTYAKGSWAGWTVK